MKKHPRDKHAANRTPSRARRHKRDPQAIRPARMACRFPPPACGSLVVLALDELAARPRTRPALTAPSAAARAQRVAPATAVAIPTPVVAASRLRRRASLGLTAISLVGCSSLTTQGAGTVPPPQPVLRIQGGAFTASHAYALGKAALQANQAQRALLYFERALELRPAWADAENGRVVALARSGRTETAIGMARRAIAMGTTSAELHGNLGLLLRTRGDSPDEAAVHLARATQLDPSNPAWKPQEPPAQLAAKGAQAAADAGVSRNDGQPTPAQVAAPATAQSQPAAPATADIGTAPASLPASTARAPSAAPSGEPAQPVGAGGTAQSSAPATAKGPQPEAPSSAIAAQTVASGAPPVTARTPGVAETARAPSALIGSTTSVSRLVWVQQAPYVLTLMAPPQLADLAAPRLTVLDSVGQQRTVTRAGPAAVAATGDPGFFPETTLQTAGPVYPQHRQRGPVDPDPDPAAIARAGPAPSGPRSPPTADLEAVAAAGGSPSGPSAEMAAAAGDPPTVPRPETVAAAGAPPSVPGWPRDALPHLAAVVPSDFEGTRIEVSNGNGERWLARRTASALRDVGWTSKMRLTNHQNFRVVETQVQYRGPSNLAAAHALADALGVPGRLVMNPDLYAGSPVRLLLGRDAPALAQRHLSEQFVVARSK